MTVVRWPGKTRGALGFACFFLVLFFGQAKKTNKKCRGK
jgi:hypothetical protein